MRLQQDGKSGELVCRQDVKRARQDEMHEERNQTGRALPLTRAALR